MADWQSFILWPGAEDRFLSNVPKQKVFPFNCVNFMPDLRPRPEEKVYDLAVISRPSSIKKIAEILWIIRGLLDRKPDLKAVIMVPDSRRWKEAERTFEAQGLDRRFYTLPTQIFSASELWNNLTFICNSDEVFGRFPISSHLMLEQLARSRFLLSFSELEGTPRAFAEALMLGVPVMHSKDLKSSMTSQMGERDRLLLPSAVEDAVPAILEGLKDPGRYQVNSEFFRTLYSEKEHLPRLQAGIEEVFRARGLKIEGEWTLRDLSNRLPCHGKWHNSQLYRNPNLFFDWLCRLETHSVYDEEKVWGRAALADQTPWGFEAMTDALVRLGRRYSKKIMHRIKTPC